MTTRTDRPSRPLIKSNNLAPLVVVAVVALIICPVTVLRRSLVLGAGFG